MTRGAALALIGGIAAALGHAPFQLWFLAFPGFVLLIWSVATASTARRAFGRGWLGAFGYFGIALHWIVEPFLVDAATHGWMAPFALLLLAGGLALFWGLAGAIAQRLGTGLASTAIAFALAVSVAELVRAHIFTGFPWAMPAYLWAETPLLQVAAYTGSFGLTSVTLVLAALVALVGRSIAAPVTGVIALAALWTLGVISPGPAATNTLGTVGIVHPNIPQSEKWQREKVDAHVERLIDLTRQAASSGPDLVVLPEVAVVYPLDVAGRILSELAEASGAAWLATGINRRDGEDWYNSVVMLDGAGAQSDLYDKVHLVPFGEYIPFKLAIFRAMAATSSNGFTAGSDVRLLDTPIGRALPLICYEGIFPRQLFKAEERADYILLVTNDAWFGSFAGPQQHFEQARFRAVEQGLSVVRVANRGLSAVIDPSGSYADPLGLESEGARGVSVPRGAPTLYSRTGDLPHVVVLIAALTALSLAKRRNALAKNSRAS